MQENSLQDIEKRNIKLDVARTFAILCGRNIIQFYSSRLESFK